MFDGADERYALNKKNGYTVLTLIQSQYIIKMNQEETENAKSCCKLL